MERGRLPSKRDFYRCKLPDIFVNLYNNVRHCMTNYVDSLWYLIIRTSFSE